MLAEMLEQVANLAKTTYTPSHLRGNLSSFIQVERALNLGSGKFLLPDVAEIGVTKQWLGAAGMADKYGVKVSSHLYPEISAPVLALITNTDYFESAD